MHHLVILNTLVYKEFLLYLILTFNRKWLTRCCKKRWIDGITVNALVCGFNRHIQNMWISFVVVVVVVLFKTLKVHSVFVKYSASSCMFFFYKYIILNSYFVSSMS